MNRSLEGRTALVTGAASGIGRAIAVRYAAAGAAVVLADVAERPWHGGEPTEAVITEAGGTASWVWCDMADPTSVEAAVATTVSTYGSLDVVVNNAAINADRSLLDTTLAEWSRVLAVNLDGVFVMCRSAISHMVTQQPRDPRGEVRGRIINITSQHGLVRAPNDVAYGTSKAAVIYLTRYIAAEHAADGIVCNALAPGKIETGPSERAGDPDWQQYWTSRTPWPRLGHPDDVAGAALFLASDDASYLTGVNLMVDGGWMAG